MKNCFLSTHHPSYIGRCWFDLVIGNAPTLRLYPTQNAFTIPRWKSMHYKVTSKYTIIFLANHYVYLSLFLDDGRNLTHTYKELTNVRRFLNPLLVTNKLLSQLYIWSMVLILQNPCLHLQLDNFQKLCIHPCFRFDKQFFWRSKFAFALTPRNNQGCLKET
jgi:hypothetical protein